VPPPPQPPPAKPNSSDSTDEPFAGYDEAIAKANAARAKARRAEKTALANNVSPGEQLYSDKLVQFHRTTSWYPETTGAAAKRDPEDSGKSGFESSKTKKAPKRTADPPARTDDHPAAEPPKKASKTVTLSTDTTSDAGSSNTFTCSQKLSTYARLKINNDLLREQNARLEEGHALLLGMLHQNSAPFPVPPKEAGTGGWGKMAAYRRTLAPFR
jgi:hypothetical protein